MDLDEIRERVRKIAEDHDGDPEYQHSEEDDLRRDVLRFIGKQATFLRPDEIEALVEETMKTEMLSFPRWCA